jgi:hypothetical protein
VVYLFVFQHRVYLGGFGVDFSMNSENLSADVSKVAKGLLEHGVTSFCPTIVTSKPELYTQVSCDSITEEMNVDILLFFRLVILAHKPHVCRINLSTVGQMICVSNLLPLLD